MKSLILVFCLISATRNVFAELCSASTRVDPCTPVPGPETNIAKRDIKDTIEAAQKMDRAVKDAEAQYRLIRGSHTEAELAACAAYRAKKAAQDQLFRDAMKMTQDLYHVHPDETGPKRIALTSDPAGAWTSGMDAHWRPEVVDSQYPPISHAWAIKGNATGGGKGDDHLHFVGEVIDPTKYSGFTLPDGEVVILRETFDLAVKNDNPGILARALYHETRHYNYLSRPAPNSAVVRGWSSKEEDERDAYKDDAAMASVFGLSTKDQIYLKSQWKLYDSAARAVPRRRTSQYVTPNGETKWEIRYDDHQINIEKEYNDLKKAVEKAHKDQENLARAQQQAAIDAARQEQNRREDEAAREGREAQAVSRTAAVVKECGFEPEFDDTNDVFVGYRLGGNHLRLFNPPQGQNMDEFRVSLMLERTCSAVSAGRAEHVDPPCNDGISILNKHANDPTFLSAVGTILTDRHNYNNPTISPDACIIDKIKQMRFPLDLKQYKRLFQPEIKRNVNWNKQDEKEKEKASEIDDWNRQNEARGAQNTTPRPNPRPAPTDGCKWAYPGGGLAPVRMCPPDQQ